MAYGKIKADTFVYDNSGSDAEVTVASLGNKASLPASAGTVGASEVVQVDANKDITGFRNVTLSGNLQVNGTTTTVASSTMTVTDKNIEIAKGAANDAAADGAGITVDSGDGDKTWNWVDATDAWTSSEHIHLGDNKKLLGGSDSDLQVYHTGSHHFQVNTTGNTLYQSGEHTFYNADASETLAVLRVNGSCDLYHDNSKKFETTANGVTVTGTVSDSLGDVRKLTNSTQTSAYTLVAADAGKYVIMQGSGGDITVPDSVFSAGQMITLINHNTSDLTIIKGTNMFYTADGSNANRTLAGKGMATLLFTDSATCYISGAGLS